MSSSLFGLSIAALVSFAMWWLIPGSEIDHLWFSFTTSHLSESETACIVRGSGTQQEPYLRTAPSGKTPEPLDHLPTEILITDDPDQIFQSSPPSPIDFAVILKNLQRMGRESIAIGTPLFWDNPDNIASMALERQLEVFPSLITSSPLSRSPKETAIPPTFQRASIPLSAIKGNTSLLPRVNHIPIPNLILGSKNALAGFTILESEPFETEAHEDTPYLMAQWGDRVVFSFQLLVALEHLGITLDAIDIELGQSIKLGTGDHRIPIDEFGRFLLTSSSSESFEAATLTADSLINAPDDALSGIQFAPIVIRDSQPTSDERFARFSNHLATHITMLATPTNHSAGRMFTRLQKGVEILLLSALLFAITAMLEFLSAKTSRLALVALLASTFILHLTLISTIGIVLPSIPAFTAILISIFLTFRRSSPAAA